MPAMPMPLREARSCTPRTARNATATIFRAWVRLRRLKSSSVKSAKPGELFWFITNGNLNNGMPSWSNLPKQQRWQIVTFLESQNK